MGTIFQREPARVAGVVTNFIAAVLLLLAAFGLDLSDGQQNAILGAIAPAVIFIQMMFEMARNQVVPVAKAAPLISTALQADPETAPAELVTALQEYDLSSARQIASTVEKVADPAPDTDIVIEERLRPPGAI